MTNEGWKPDSSEDFAKTEKAGLDAEKEKLAKADAERPGLRTEMSQEHIMQFFAYDHLREGPKEVSKACHDLAHALLSALPRNPERTVALRKLLEAKDAAVRAFIAK